MSTKLNTELNTTPLYDLSMRVAKAQADAGQHYMDALSIDDQLLANYYSGVRAGLSLVLSFIAEEARHEDA